MRTRNNYSRQKNTKFACYAFLIAGIVERSSKTIYERHCYNELSFATSDRPISIAMFRKVRQKMATIPSPRNRTPKVHPRPGGHRDRSEASKVFALPS